jgi:hypothetical protein
VSAPAGEHLPLELLIDYFADDVEPAQLDAIEGHLFACTSCTAEAERVVQVVASLRALPPVGITRAQIAALQARGVRVREADFAAEVRKVAEFTPGDDVLIHHLSGLDLAHAERVHVTVKVESSGATLVEDHFAPFDRERGAVSIACQRHFDRFPPDVLFEVRVYGPGREPALSRYLVPHVFGR